MVNESTIIGDEASDLQTREQMLSEIAKPFDILELLGKVYLVQYKNGWQSKSLATEASREISRLRTLLSRAEKREREARSQALDDCETHVRQALIDAAYVHREKRDISSGIFKAETYATAAINSLRVAE